MELTIELKETKPEHSPVKENFALDPMENVLVLEPLLNRPEWFDESQPVEITEEMLRSVPGAGEKLIERFLDVKKRSELFPDEKIAEKMNPFRANVVTPIMVSAKGVFIKGDAFKNYREHAEGLLGNKFDEIKKETERLFETIENKKRIGTNIRTIPRLIEIEEFQSYPNQKKVEAFRNLMKEIPEASKVNVEDLRKVYALGRLASLVIRETEVLPKIDNDPNELVQKILKPEVEIEKVDFLKKVDEVKFGDFSI